MHPLASSTIRRRVPVRSPEAGRLLQAVGVTGTNGKTTTTSMVAAIVAAGGQTPARVTTVGSFVGGTPVQGPFGERVRAAVAGGASVIAVETTAQALSAGFANRWTPDVAVFTNFSHDHLNRFGTPAVYQAAKARLFQTLHSGAVAVLNLDDPVSAALAAVLPPGVTVRGYGHKPHAAAARLPWVLRLTHIAQTDAGLTFALDLDGRPLVWSLPMLGEVNAWNAAAAALAGLALGTSLAHIQAGLATFGGVSGRFERVGDHPLVLVDYAHTPDALEMVLQSARALAHHRAGRVVLVFGCGGDCDTEKRRPMGDIANVSADVVVLTSDNPRTECPTAIADQVQPPVQAHRAVWTRELDRAEAIALAIRNAADADVVIVAGKGHEEMQDIGGLQIPFSDRAVCRAALATKLRSGA